jgi:hypothetical protein
MPNRDDHRWRDGDEEPEPDWAEQIRAGRKARGDRLRDVFATFDDDDDAGTLASPSERRRPATAPARKPKPAQPSRDDAPYDQEHEESS